MLSDILYFLTIKKQKTGILMDLLRLMMYNIHNFAKDFQGIIIFVMKRSKFFKISVIRNYLPVSLRCNLRLKFE